MMSIAFCAYPAACCMLAANSRPPAISPRISPQLTEEQVQYALGDVRHLHALYEKLCHNLRERNLMALARSCYEHIPARVSLELRGYGDVYSY